MPDIDVDRVDQLYAIASRYQGLFPEGATPLGYVVRLAEEVGEIAVEVQRLEGAPAKIAKHGVGDLGDLASEVEDLLHTALGLVQLYGARDALDAALAREFLKVTGERRPD